MWDVISDTASSVFGGDSSTQPLQAGQIAARACLIYVLGILLVRLGKSRMLSRATPLDVLLGFILGSLLSRGINGSGSLSGTLVASSVLVGVHWFITAAGLPISYPGAMDQGTLLSVDP
jgi:hypothetical protein